VEVHVAVLPAPSTAVPVEKEPSTFRKGITEKQLIHKSLRFGAALYPPMVYVHIVGVVAVALHVGTLRQYPDVPEGDNEQVASEVLLKTYPEAQVTVA
jgi:hypothetical protein